MDITIKESKVYTTFMFIFYSVVYAAFLMLEGFMINDIIDYYNVNQSIDVSSLCISIVGFVLLSIFFAFCILSTLRTRNATYTFTNDKIIKVYKQNVKWEISYSDIQTFMVNGLMLTIIYKKSTVDDKSKKAVSITEENRTEFKNAISFHGYFNKSDLQSIKEKITVFNTENGRNIRIV